MAIEPEFAQFENEAQFTSRFLVPLLRRLGFSIVCEFHGKREFGKDLVFAEIDRFGEISFHGLQSKFEGSIGQSASEGLIEDCKQAFRHPFQHRNTGAEHRISSFFVANAGAFADNARENFFREATNSGHGGNVRLLDGKGLLVLDRWATINRVERIGEMLFGLVVELRFNRAMMNQIAAVLRDYAANQGGIVPSERLRTDALSHYVQKPDLPNRIDTAVVMDYIVTVDRGINAPLDFISAPMNTVPAVLNRVNIAQVAISKAIMLGDSLEAAITAIIGSLGPLAAI